MRILKITYPILFIVAVIARKIVCMLRRNNKVISISTIRRR